MQVSGVIPANAADLDTAFSYHDETEVAPLDISQAQLAKHSQASVEWYTPPDIIERARRVMGRIDLDPASCEKANTIVKAERFFSGIGAPDPLAPWYGNVFNNPPGGCYDKQGRPAKQGKGAAKTWWGKLTFEYRIGNVHQAIFLGFNLDVLQNTQSFGAGRRILDYPFVIPRDRIRFLRGDTLEPCKSPTHANVIAYLPPTIERVGSHELGAHLASFIDSFGELGRVRA